MGDQGSQAAVLARYFDTSATTPAAAEVLEAMALAQATAWANPSSLHLPGLAAAELLERVGLADAFALAPAQLSGGMRKRAALARALALDPPLLLLDEPGSGLDPLNAQRLDELVLELRHHLGTAVVMVTHEIRSVRAVADRALYLDDKEMTMTAIGTPEELAGHASSVVRRFFTAGGGLES